MATLTLKHGTKTDRVVHLDMDEFVVGRGTEAHLELEQDVVSRRHCLFKQVGADWVVEDLESASGTLVGGRKISRHVLKPGDEVQVGRSTLVFAPDDPKGGLTEKEMGTNLFWAQAAEDSGITAAVEDKKDGLKTDAGRSPSAAGAPKEVSARDMAAKNSPAAGAADFRATMMASPEELARARTSLELSQKPHLSVSVGGKREILPIGEEAFVAGWTDGMDFRFPGSKWFGKTAFIITKKGKGHEIAPQSMWTAVQLNGERLKEGKKLKNGANIEAGGMKFRFGTGE
jgi:hypothetical protein